MKLTSGVFIACCLLNGSRLTAANQIQPIFDGLQKAVTDLNNSVEIFIALLASVPVERTVHSANMIRSLHRTTIELVIDIYAIVKSVYANSDGGYDAKSIALIFRETTKTVAYSNELKDMLSKVLKGIFDLDPEKSCPLLPIGPPRVYGSYAEMKGTFGTASNKSDHEKFIENVADSINAGTASVGIVAQIFLGHLHGEVSNGKVHVVQELIYYLLNSLNKTFHVVLTAADGLYDITMYEKPAIISVSNIIRQRTEAIRDSVIALLNNLS